MLPARTNRDRKHLCPPQYVRNILSSFATTLPFAAHLFCGFTHETPSCVGRCTENFILQDLNVDQVLSDILESVALLHFLILILVKSICTESVWLILFFVHEYNFVVQSDVEYKS